MLLKQCSMVIIRLSLLLALYTGMITQAQVIPRKCATDESIVSGRCCPIGADGSSCNVASGRGKCTKINPPKIYKPNLIKRFPRMTLDPRFMWPSKVFQKVSLSSDHVFFIMCIYVYINIDNRLVTRRVNSAQKLKFLRHLTIHNGKECISNFMPI